jgi:uncharacterized membrane protein YhaH (DUF805 family)
MAMIWLVNVILYILIVRKAFIVDSSAFSTVVIRLSLYILAALVANFPALVNRIQNAVEPSHPVFVLFMFHAICNPLQGFCNAVVYSSSAPLRSAYKQFFKLHCCCCCRGKNGLNHMEDDAPFQYDEEEEAYEQFRQTLSMPHSGISGDGGYLSADGSTRGTFETEPLLSGSYSGIQQPQGHYFVQGAHGSHESFSSWSEYTTDPAPSSSSSAGFIGTS